jgi:hypothetical protein
MINGDVMNKDAIKDIIGRIPFTVELYWLLHQGGRPPESRFKLKSLQSTLPQVCAELKSFAEHAEKGQNVFIFATLHYWIEHAAMLGLALAGYGHRVTLGYLPYGDWYKPINRFDLRRQNAYARQVLQETAPWLRTVSLLEVNPVHRVLPDELQVAVEQVSLFDTQYTLQIEEVDPANALYRLRKERNEAVALSALTWLKSHRPDVVIVPNGIIQELGMVYHVARSLNIPTVTYEFGDQNERIWLAQNAQIMRQETDGLWLARRGFPVGDTEMERVRSMYAARQQSRVWENFARSWQGTPTQGGEQARAALGLDDRPVALLATNVLGDSLTLGRQVFSRTMAEWITRTVQFFAIHPEIQLVIRVHPGEALTQGVSMVEVVHQALPELPDHIHLVAPEEKINTYDLVELAAMGLVYTTTVGMEMAMSGIPVVVAGKTHYCGRGFTFDPLSWEAYFDQLRRFFKNPTAHRLSEEKVNLAWQYAYRFFFEFPRPFPWHLVRMWSDYKLRPMRFVLGEEGRAHYDATFRYLVGEPLDWAAIEG